MDIYCETHVKNVILGACAPKLEFMQLRLCITEVQGVRWKVQVLLVRVAVGNAPLFKFLHLLFFF